MKRLALAAVLVFAPVAAWAEVVLAGHPLTAGLAQALTKGTPVEVVAVVPANLPMSRQQAFLTGRGEPVLAEAARRADAVVTLRAAWPEDPLYPLARRANIRLVEIDATRPVDKSLPGIAMAGDAPFPWLSLTNIARMADIVGSDLKRLYPAQAAAIGANGQAIKAGLLAISAQAAKDLATAPDVGVVVLSDRFAALAADLGLEVRAAMLHDDKDWTPERLRALTAFLKANQVPMVLHHRDPAPDIADAIRGAGARLLVLDSFDAGPPVDPISAAARLADGFRNFAQ